MYIQKLETGLQVKKVEQFIVTVNIQLPIKQFLSNCSVDGIINLQRVFEET